MATDKRRKQNTKAGQADELSDHRLAFVTTARNGGFADPAAGAAAAVPTDQVDLRNELEYFDPERWDGMS